VNASGDIVGQSCNADGVCRGFVWDRGTMHDLQSLVVSGDDVYILAANDIDDAGRITGQGVDNATGAFVAFLATPLE